MKKYVLRKPGGVIWGLCGHTQDQLFNAVNSGRITTEWQASDGIRDWTVGDLISTDSSGSPGDGAKISSSSAMSAIYILSGDEQQGPFAREQILTMHQSGRITSDSLFWFDGLTEWHPVSKLLQAEKAKNQAQLETLVAPYIRLGIIFVIIGLGLICYFVGIYDTSVEVGGPLGSLMDVGRVNNVGRMQTKQTGIIIGCCSTVLGFALLFFAQMKKGKV
ncbi:MAG: DUF4339 domain-containing protein [Chthoniobacterales bacterium]|nr:DUF4339 domain-containing protein [Chthoniobacterales bacterium]